ncbi:hypothetical protein [Aquirhabdus parva]|uniref:Uncharacterized protein n=1 Tax=Aquirhabdus parva TaxID=2283318 RepID=A0A345PAS5_9GAMM|nr:hypothetical protein [Aquirhabdus parva]AXI01438.1 hypothetical protein HYN46_00085 [Aquirhabdus parva]AXI04384.1 hypothetical protein HYN46_17000 [Aquirhabdus parva]
MAVQNANSVAVSGGTINNTSVGVTTAAAGRFTTLTTTSGGAGGVTINAPASVVVFKTDDASEVNFNLKRIGAVTDTANIQIRHLATGAFDIRSLNDAGSAANSVIRAERGTGIAWSNLTVVPQSGQVTVGTSTAVSADKFGVSGRGYFTGGVTSMVATELDGTANGALYVSNQTTGQAQLTFIKKGAGTDAKMMDVLLAPSGAFIIRSTGDNWSSTVEALRVSRGSGSAIDNMQLLPAGGQLLVGLTSSSGTDKLRVNGTTSLLGPLNLPKYTLSTLPSAAATNGYLIDVTDATGGAKTCRSNGTNWVILNTTTTVS